MSTEGKITENQKTTEQPKRRFKLDKKHIQGFVAGILLCAIAFTGLYYGTDGRFFKGSISGSLPIVTDKNFEREVLKYDGVVLVVSSSDSYYIEELTWMSSEEYLFPEKAKAVILDVGNSSKTMQAYDMWNNHRVLVFKDGKEKYFRDYDAIMWWLMFKYR